MLAPAIPLAFNNPSCGAFTSTDNPAGVSARVVSGDAEKEGRNAGAEQPCIAGICATSRIHEGSLKSGVPSVFNAPGCCQESARNNTLNGSPEQLVGIVKNGSGVLPTSEHPWTTSCGTSCTVSPSIPRHSPRNSSWLGSA